MRPIFLTMFYLAPPPVRFEFEKKASRINMRLPNSLLNAVKAKAAVRGIPYQRLIREVLEKEVSGT